MATAKARQVRSSALRAQNMFPSVVHHGHQYDTGSDDEEEYLKGGRQQRRFGTSRIDLSKLETNTLLKYRKVYKLPDHPAASREDLLQAIVRHFANVYVDEDETLIRFAMACRRKGQQQYGAKKPRTGSVKPRGGR